MTSENFWGRNSEFGMGSGLFTMLSLSFILLGKACVKKHLHNEKISIYTAVLVIQRSPNGGIPLKMMMEIVGSSPVDANDAPSVPSQNDPITLFGNKYFTTSSHHFLKRLFLNECKSLHFLRQNHQLKMPNDLASSQSSQHEATP
jgi:hypothetical protein